MKTPSATCSRDWKKLRRANPDANEHFHEIEDEIPPNAKNF
jgi:hypothetical protein